MPQITRKFRFCAGHRVLNHEGKCRHLHGHDYGVEITVSSLGLDDLGRVVDFSVIKEKLGTWIDEELDHNMLLHPDDPLLNTTDSQGYFKSGCEPEVLIGRIPFMMPEYAPNPTAENIAHVIFNQAKELLNNGGLSVEQVTVWETPNCCATHK